MSKRGLGLIVIVLLAFLLAAVFLLNTEGGSRWLLQRIFTAVPGTISASTIEGRLFDRIRISGFDYVSENSRYHINQLDCKWRPAQLFTRRLTIDHFIADGIRIKLADSRKTDESGIDLGKGLQLPVKPALGKLLLTDIDIEKNGSKQHVDKIHLATKTEGERIMLSTLTVEADIVKLEGSGFVATGQNFPLDVNLTWQTNLGEQGVWRGISRFNGDLLRLTTVHTISSPAKINAQGMLENLLTFPRADLQADWQNLQWPVTVMQPQVNSPQGKISIAGSLSDYKVSLNAELRQPQLELAFVNLNAIGNAAQLKIGQFDIKSDHGLFQVDGTVSWANKPAFDIAAHGRAFNPAILIPELPGNLNIDSRIRGSMVPGGLRIDADIGAIKGRLRGQPFNANGRLLFTGEQLKVNELKLASGVNKLYVNGNIEKTMGNLDIDIDMPRLSGLWPMLAGSLQGGGRIHGGWQKPSANITLTGNQLRFGKHSAKAVNLDVAYSPNERRHSVVNLSAVNVASGDLTIDRLTLNGKGNLPEHQVNLDLITSKGNLSTALTGSWRDPRWQARLTAFDLTDIAGRHWTLAKALPIQLERKPPGVQITVNEGCIVYEASALCGKINYAANADFNLGLTARALPAELIRPWLPPEVSIAAELNGFVNLQRKNQRLAGDYQFATTPASIKLSAADGMKTVELEPSTLAGTIRHEDILANLQLNLAGNDFVHSQIQVNTGSAQTISGGISAKVNNLSVFQPIIPQVNALSGKLSADLKLKGTLKQPRIEGFVNLAEGSIDSGRMGLRQANLQASVSASQNNRIRLSGSAVPVINNPPQARETVNLKSLLNFTADIRQDPAWNGEFQINLPSTALSMVKQGKLYDIALGNSSIQGNLVNNTLSADLLIALTQQDAIRGRLRLGLDEPRPLSAKLNASIRDFRIVQAFVPDISRIQGLLTLDLTADGKLAKPLINGKLNINGGAVDLASLGISVNQIALQAGTPPLTNDVIQVLGSAKSGDGKINLDGTIKLAPELHWPAEFKLTGERFEVARLPEAEINVSPDLRLVASAGQTKITGKIDVPKAVIKIQDIPENAVKVSPDEIIVGEEVPETEQVKAPSLLADIRVMLGEDCRFTGQGLTTDLNGNLRIIKTAGNMAMQGSVNLSNAAYKSYGQNLTVRKGQFVFTGPVENPWVNVEAFRLSKDRKVTAILALHGPLDNPQTQISSEPSLPESEALAYLLTGAPLNQVGKSEGGMLASAALAYGADQMGWLANEFGITDFGVQEGNNLKDTLLVMGRYLTPDFYLGAKVGMFNKQAVLVLKHKVFDGFNVETQAGTSQRIKLNYEFDSD